MLTAGTSPLSAAGHCTDWCSNPTEQFYFLKTIRLRIGCLLSSVRYIHTNTFHMSFPILMILWHTYRGLMKNLGQPTFQTELKSLNKAFSLLISERKCFEMETFTSQLLCVTSGKKKLKKVTLELIQIKADPSLRSLFFFFPQGSVPADSIDIIIRDFLCSKWLLLFPYK